MKQLNHAYHYQMQQQLEICNEEMECQYGDFVVRTQNEIFIESTLPDNKFWEDNLPKLDNFFEVGILPAIVGKYHTNLSLASEQTVYKILVVISPRIKIPTFQIQGNSGALVEAMKDMVGCDNENCKWKWLYFDCIGLKRAPKSKVWYCPDCRRLPEFRKDKKRKQKWFFVYPV